MPETREWVGGKLTFPFAWKEEGQVFEPEMILWIEMPGEVLLGCHLVNPKAPKISFSESLMETMSSPLVGPPRRPERIRIVDSSLISELGQTLGNIELVHSKTPELDEILFEIGKRMLESNLVSSS